MASEIFDYVVVGSGLTGLIIAKALSEQTTKVALIEGLDAPGGFNRSILLANEKYENGIRMIAKTPSSESLVSFLASQLSPSVQLASTLVDTEIATYDSGQFKSFVGFGDHPPSFYTEISYFLNAQKHQLSLTPSQWTQSLFEGFKGTFFPRSFATQFVKDEASHKISHVLINGSKTISGHQFIFAGSSQEFPALCSDEVLPYRQKNKLSKGPYWTALCLDLVHNGEVTSEKRHYLLDGTTQDDLGPATGHFDDCYQTEQGLRQASHWITFMEKDQTEDSEAIGLALKKIKRQIKRAFPTAFDNLVMERILISANISGDAELKLVDGLRIPTVDNLWIASPQLSRQGNLLGSLDMADKMLKSLGFSKTTSFEQSESHPPVEATSSAEL